VGELRNGPAINLVLLASVLVFGLLLYDKIVQSFS
jgi:hypothetical protein